MFTFTKSCLYACVLIAAPAMHAAVVTIPDSDLTPTTQLYTAQTGVSIGNIVVMTGGGNAPGIGDPTGRNDDGFSGPINLGFSIGFFGQNYNQFWINNNGDISFNSGIAQFTPTGPQGASEPVISPYFADVDTRGANSGVVYVNQSIANEIIITWDGVGYYNSHDDELDTFQLVLRGPGYNVPAGEGQIGFFWTGMQWETGDASGGTNGFGGTPAAVGFGDGNQNGQVLQGSIQNGISGIVNDEQIWFNLNDAGAPVVAPPGQTTPASVPEPSTLLLLPLGIGGLVWRRLKRGRQPGR